MPTNAVRKPLRLLLLEDSASDAAVILAELDQSGYNVQHIRTYDAATMREALNVQPFDLVICDFNMPQFDALAALRIVRERHLDVPFIVVSGTIGEEKAVEMMRAGAQDYILKDSLNRLIPAIDRELRMATARRDRIRIESALHASERGRAMLLNVIESATDVIAVFRPTLNLLYMNEGGRRLLDIPDAAQAAALSFADLHPPWALDTIRHEAMPRAAAVGSWVSETALLTRDRREIPVWQVLGCQKDGNGLVEYFFTIMRDLTERKNMQASLMLADRVATVGLLAASIAHEINNPLTYVDGYLDRAIAIVEKARYEGDLLPSLAHAKEGVTRVKGIARDLKIFFGRGDAAAPEPVPLNEILDSSLKMAAFETRHRATVLREYYAPVFVRAHESRLGQVFVNLIVNAAHAMTDGDVSGNRIIVRTLPVGADRVAVEVEDSGSGIPADRIQRIFEPFYTTKPVGIGTGLGLVVCKDIVISYGGTIDVTSVVGRGTTFRVTLPAADAPDATPIAKDSVPIQTTPRESTPAATFPRGRVLIVDDEPAIVEFLSCMLEVSCEVHQASGGDQAIEVLRREGEFDAIISDVMMRDGSGIKLYEMLAAERPGAQRRIIFMTGGAPTADVQRFLDVAGNPQVAKPFDVKELVRIVERFVRERS